jgi:23S rRNA pseudouridine2604 synthase
MDSGKTSLNKYISSSGFCSRREADKLIAQARVTINSELVVTAAPVYPGDVVEIDGEPVHKTKARPIYIAFNKPVGVTATTDPKDRSNIIYFINHPKRIFPIGRLDKDSDGLIFLTNDGDIVNKILRASNNHEKEYIVSVDKAVTPGFIKEMGGGIPMLGTVTKKCFVRQEGGRRFRIILTQGMNRQIRRMCEYLDYKVMSLTRVRIMNVELSNLPPGKWRYLTIAEVDKMNELVAASSKTDTRHKSGFVERKTIAPEILPVKKENVDMQEDDAELQEWIEKRSAPKRSTYAEFRKGVKSKQKKEGRFEKPAMPDRNTSAADTGNKKGAPPKGKAPGKPKGKAAFSPAQTQSVKQYVPKRKKK